MRNRVSLPRSREAKCSDPELENVKVALHGPAFRSCGCCRCEGMDPNHRCACGAAVDGAVDPILGGNFFGNNPFLGGVTEGRHKEEERQSTGTSQMVCQHLRTVPNNGKLA